MSWNATADRLRAQAQQYGLANDYVTAKLLYEAVDEIERIARERDEARAQAERVPNPGDLGVILALANGAPMGPFDRAAFARVRATLEKEDDRE